MKILALVVGSIAMFPSVCLADNISGNNQAANINSNVIGNGNVVVINNIQSINSLQSTGNYGSSGGNRPGRNEVSQADGREGGDRHRDHERRGHHRREHGNREGNCNKRWSN